MAWRSPVNKTSKLGVGQGSSGEGKSVAVGHFRAVWSVIEKRKKKKQSQKENSGRRRRKRRSGGGKSKANAALLEMPEAKIGRAESGPEAKAQNSQHPPASSPPETLASAFCKIGQATVWKPEH